MHSDVYWKKLKKGNQKGSKLLMKTQSYMHNSGKQREVHYYLRIIVYILQIEYSLLDFTNISNRWPSVAF